MNAAPKLSTIISRMKLMAGIGIPVKPECISAWAEELEQLALAPPSGQGVEPSKVTHDAALAQALREACALYESQGKDIEHCDVCIGVLLDRTREILRTAATPQSASVDSKEPSMITATPGSVFDDRPVNTEHPLFERIWQTIKQWDIQRAPGAGYAGATGTDVQIIIDAITTPPPASQERGGDREANCWADPCSDTWFDFPDDAEFVHGRKLGDEYELQASVRAWTERFRVVKVPDEASDDYEVVRVSPPSSAAEDDQK